MCRVFIVRTPTIRYASLRKSSGDVAVDVDVDVVGFAEYLVVRSVLRAGVRSVIVSVSYHMLVPVGVVLCCVVLCCCVVVYGVRGGFVCGAGLDWR